MMTTSDMLQKMQQLNLDKRKVAISAGMKQGRLTEILNGNGMSPAKTELVRIDRAIELGAGRKTHVR